jgi:hypothetical protein
VELNIMGSAWTPSIVPGGTDQNIYLVLDDFGRLGRAWRETSVERTDLRPSSRTCWPRLSQALAVFVTPGGFSIQPFSNRPSLPLPIQHTHRKSL